MSMFENSQYQWRETYFVLFPAQRRPKLKEVQKAISKLHQHLTLTNLSADEKGLLESLTILAPDDFAALDISYLAGEEVREQVAELAKEVEPSCCCQDEKERLEELRKCDARLDIFHFEQMADLDSEEDGMFDPSALLVVLDTLAELTDGISVDPQGGAML
ncbi:MAG: hypothetical protein GXX96_16090 [Planctomycetaceae bacterium]|nr:hypothetical protein [Planctomycetaceae bacterium]